MGNANITGARIREARERLKIGQSELAMELEVGFSLNMDQSDISEIERGVRGVKDFELDAIARVLKVNPTGLLRGNSGDG